MGISVRMIWLIVLSLLYAGCEKSAPTKTPAPPLAPSPAAEVGIKIDSNDLVQGDVSDSKALEPNREALSGIWDLRNGDRALALQFLKPGDSLGLDNKAVDGTARLDWTTKEGTG